MCDAQQKQGLVLRPLSKGRGSFTPLGYAKIEVTYAFNAMDLDDERTYIDLQVLQSSESQSKYYSRFLEQEDSLCDEYKKKNPGASSVPWVYSHRGRNSEYWSEYQFTEIFSQKGEFTFYVRMPYAMERYNCYYTEPMMQQCWELKNERQEILGFQCQKACCNWRGRSFIAWFSPEIPIRQGPWCFGGLPGLILSIHDEGMLYHWEAIGIRFGKIPMTKRNFKGFRYDTRAHVYQLLVAINRDYLKTGGARDRKTGLLKSSPHPYEPLEKE